MTTPCPPLDVGSLYPTLAPCEHIAGNERFIKKAFALQQDYVDATGRSLVDVTLDLEDGAPVGQEEHLRQLFIDLLHDGANKYNQTGIRVHPVDSEHFESDIKAVVSKAADRIAYITIPKVRSAREVSWAVGVIQHYASQHRKSPLPISLIPLHLLIETPESLTQIRELAAIEVVQTLDFGLMDFISHAASAIPADCMKSPGQFSHPLISSVKSQIALAALGANKIPSHNVTVDVRDPEQAYQDAYRARHEFGYLRMWSIHPSQIDPIIRGMTPSQDELLEAKEILARAEHAAWGPIQYNGRLHDRASYRYYWWILSRGSAQGRSS